MQIKIPIRVYIEDTDAGGIVYYVNYLKYFERARTELMRSLGFEKSGGNTAGVQFVVAKLEVQYLKPATLDDLLEASAEVTKMRGASIDFKQQIIFKDKVICTANVCVALVDAESLKPIRLSGEFKQKLKNK